MPRGRGADDLFYGEELGSALQTLPEDNSGVSDSDFSDEIYALVGELDWPRNPETLERDDDGGEYLLSVYKPFQACSCQDTPNSHGEYLSIDLVQIEGEELEPPELRIETSVMSKGGDRSVVYSGDSLRGAARAAQEKAFVWGEECFPLSVEDVQGRLSTLVRAMKS